MDRIQFFYIYLFSCLTVPKNKKKDNFLTNFLNTCLRNIWMVPKASQESNSTNVSETKSQKVFSKTTAGKRRKRIHMMSSSDSSDNEEDMEPSNDYHEPEPEPEQV